MIGVVEPGARAAVAATRGGPLGVIGTSGTIASGAYERAIAALAPSTTIVTAACPLFVPLVEEGWLDTEPTRLIAREYLRPLAAARVDTLVLGCTHYPLLKPLLAEEMRRAGDPTVQLIDSAEETAADTASTLRARGLEKRGGSPAYRFIASDAPEHFLRASRRFLGENGVIESVEEVRLG